MSCLIDDRTDSTTLTTDPVKSSLRITLKIIHRCFKAFKSQIYILLYPDPFNFSFMIELNHLAQDSQHLTMLVSWCQSSVFVCKHPCFCLKHQKKVKDDDKKEDSDEKTEKNVEEVVSKNIVGTSRASHCQLPLIVRASHCQGLSLSVVPFPSSVALLWGQKFVIGDNIYSQTCAKDHL